MRGAPLVGHAVAGRKVELAVARPEGDAAAEVAPVLLLRGRRVQHRGRALQRRRVRRQARPGQPRQRAAALHQHAVAEVDLARFREVGG